MRKNTRGIDDETRDAKAQKGGLDPALMRRFRRACKELNAIVKEAQKVYPGANLYLAEDQLNLLRGPSHDARHQACQENVLDSVWLPGAGGGDW